MFSVAIFLCDSRLQGIMVVVFIKTNIQSKIKITTIILCWLSSGASHRGDCLWSKTNTAEFLSGSIPLSLTLVKQEPIFDKRRKSRKQSISVGV